MAANLPTVADWTISDGRTLQIREINWAWTTTEPLFVGAINSPDGHVGHKCCTRMIGCADVALYEEEVFSYRDYLFIYLEVDARSVKLTMYSGTASGDFIWFDWQSPQTALQVLGLLADGLDGPIGSLPRGQWRELGNIQSADYDSGLLYVTEADVKTFEVMPTQCNDDGGYIHSGGQISANTDDAAGCICDKVQMNQSWTFSLSGLSNVCIDNWKLSGDTFDATLTLDLVGCLPDIGFQDSDGDDGLTVEKCDEGEGVPCDVPTTGAVHLALYWVTLSSGDMGFMRAVLSIGYEGGGGGCDHSISSTITVPWNCVDGFGTAPLTFEFSYEGSDYECTLEITPA
jgi:hypothetical protein